MNFTDFKNQFQKKPVVEYPNYVKTDVVVSVCVLAYQHENYITDCLEGILNQMTSYPFEILIGEDDSSDQTRIICKRYADNYPNHIRLFLHSRENNIIINNSPTGLFSALYNIYSANGKFIAYCDGDDFWNDTFKLQKQVDFLKKNLDYVLTYHEVKYIDKNNSLIKNHKKDNEFNKFYELSKIDLIHQIYQPLPVSICYRNIIRDIPIEITRIENADNFLISILGHYGKGKFLSTIESSFYRIHENSYWSSRDKGMKFLSKLNTYRVLEKYYLDLNDNSNRIYFRDRSIGYLKQLIVYIIKSKNLSKIKVYLKYLRDIYIQ